jgi:hypothetical protein
LQNWTGVGGFLCWLDCLRLLTVSFQSWKATTETQLKHLVANSEGFTKSETLTKNKWDLVEQKNGGKVFFPAVCNLKPVDIISYSIF